MLHLKFMLLLAATAMLSAVAQAGQINPDLPVISYVQYQSTNLLDPEDPLTISGQLRMPVQQGSGKGEQQAIPAVVLLHGSAGVDSRGSLYAEALNGAGIATLEIDMWAARNLTGGGNRPALPTLTVPDAFGALQFLAQVPGIDVNRIGVMGFSWGGVVTMLSANESYTQAFGGGLKCAALVAHYPVCWAYNIGIPGMEFDALTGSPLLIQIGALDDYDEGGDVCQALVASLDEPYRSSASVKVYPNAHHAWDRLQPPLTVEDSFSHLGVGGEVNIIPNPGKAHQSRKRAVGFFSKAFGL